jgi:hypothetical protein
MSAVAANGYVDFAPGSSHLEWVLKNGLKKNVPSNLLTKWKITFDPNGLAESDRQTVTSLLNSTDATHSGSIPAGLFAAVIASGMYDPKPGNNKDGTEVRVRPR